MTVATVLHPCAACGQDLPWEDFQPYHQGQLRAGRRARCRSCVNTKVSAWQAAERERMGEDAWRALVAERVRRHRERRGNGHTTAKGRAYSKAYQSALAKLRDRHSDEFEQLLEEEKAK